MKRRVLTALTRLGIPGAEKLEELARSGLAEWNRAQLEDSSGPAVQLTSPINGTLFAEVPSLPISLISQIDQRAHEAFLEWRMVPAPQRGEFVRRFGNELRAHKSDLADLITYEVGKIPQEALGEVQEMIDICDFAVGLSRQLHGLTIASERPGHRLMEQWHPLGPVLVITAFNFPMAVWAWNSTLAWVCGDPVIWKPSEKASLCALGVQSLVEKVLSQMQDVPQALSQLVIGDRTVAAPSLYPSVRLISATGSVPMGKAIRQESGLTRTLLELGGNNGLIVTPSADEELAIRAIVFGAVGTCGQRCTTLRRLWIHESRYAQMVDRLRGAYERLPIGDPSQPGVLVGPLIDEAAGTAMQQALEQAILEGGTVHFGHRLSEGVPDGGVYVHPALVEMPVPLAPSSIVENETFAPILYVMPYSDLEDAIAQHNSVKQGLSSAIFTNDLREAELFYSAAGSDCGLVNVNTGTSGAEIGGAFGGDKETGGGRESGSNSWTNYMRRVTSTINWSRDLPLAQGIHFEL